MKQDTKRFSSLIFATLLIAGALIVYFEFIVPAYTNLQALKGQQESEAALYANEKQIVTQAQALLSSYQSESSSSQSVSLALPVGVNAADALAQIYGIAQNVGLNINQTSVSTQAAQPSAPSAAAVAAAGSGQIEQAAAAGSIVKPVGTVSFQVNGSGSYESLKSFLEGIETNIRIFDVTQLSIAPFQQGAGKAANPDMFNYTVTVVGYYQSS